VAGDFYDFIVVDENRIGVLVADVSGHGMPAALIASMLKVAFAAQTERASDPAAVLSGLNQALCGKFQTHYVTAGYALIDTQKRKLQYAGAGHPPLLLRDGSTGTTRSILENGLFLGYFPQATYSTVEAPFQEDDWVVLYTDGVPEMLNDAVEQFGEARLEQFVNENGDRSADDFADRLMGTLFAWNGHGPGMEPDDDVTLLAIHFQGR
jgi:serine phosphatase RsbU (regulator of sigma subunit)